jgi:type IV pilus assembly protein PilV
MKSPGHFQSGSFLLEALIAILIVALGVLGSVGLLARSMQDVDDAKNRGEAAYLANLLIGRMWTSDRLTASLTAEFSSDPGSGAGYDEFRTFVEQRLPNADKYDQDVVMAAGPNPANLASSLVTITIRWCPPGEWIGGKCRGPTSDSPHVFNVTAAIGANS